MKQKQVAFRISEALRNLANQSIISYALKKNGKPESFSEYLRRLIYEDFEKCKNELIPKIKKDI